MKLRLPFTFGAGLVATLSASAATPDEAKGLWQTADKAGVIEFEFKACEKKPATLCARVVWDKDTVTPTDTCGVQVAGLQRYDGEAWRDGWIFDPRDKRRYKGAVRVKDRELHMRAFVDAEVLGQTEQLTRITKLPDGPACNKS